MCIRDRYTAAVTEQFKVRKIYTAGGKHSIYPGRVSFVLKDVNGSAIQTIFVDGKASAEFDALRFDHTGTYTYTVEEVNGLVEMCIRDRPRRAAHFCRVRHTMEGRREPI